MQPGAQGVSEGDKPGPGQTPAHVCGSFVLHRSTSLSLKEEGTSERVPPPPSTPLMPLCYCTHWEGCVGYTEATTCHTPSKTTEEKMVQPLLWPCLSHMSMNNKNRALKNKTQCFKKPPGDYFQWYLFFFFPASF